MVRKYISIKAFLKPISKSFPPDSKTANMVSFKEIWPGNELERFFVYSTIKLNGEVIFFIWEILEVFYFPSALIVVIESFKKRFLKTFSFKYVLPIIGN